MEKRIYVSHPEKAPSSNKKEEPKEPPTTADESTAGDKSAMVDPNEPMMRTTIDIPKKMHLAIRLQLLHINISLRAYVLDLIRKDFKKRGIDL